MTRFDVEQAGQQYLLRIHRAALVLTGDPWEADDLVQETFLALAQHGHRFKGLSQPYTWLYGVLLNLDRNRRRRRDVRQRGLRVLWDQDATSPRVAPSAAAQFEVAEWKRSLWSVVAQLPDGQREALVLRYSEQLSYAEIAEVMQCPLGTVKSRIFNGLAALKDQFADNESSATLPIPHADLSDAM